MPASMVATVALSGFPKEAEIHPYLLIICQALSGPRSAGPPAPVFVRAVTSPCDVDRESPFADVLYLARITGPPPRRGVFYARVPVPRATFIQRRKDGDDFPVSGIHARRLRHGARSGHVANSGQSIHLSQRERRMEVHRDCVYLFHHDGGLGRSVRLSSAAMPTKLDAGSSSSSPSVAWA